MNLIEKFKGTGVAVITPFLDDLTIDLKSINQLVDFLETGNIKNSVNFPNVQLPRSTMNRIAVTNKNVPAMIGQIATSLGELELNIADMTNVSKGDIAYNLIDIENEVKESAIKELQKIENILRI